MIIVQQNVGALVVVPYLPPLALSDSMPATAHTLTLVEDVADAALFASIALFSLIVALVEHSWVRVAGVLVAMVTLAEPWRAPWGSPLWTL